MPDSSAVRVHHVLDGQDRILGSFCSQAYALQI